MPDRRRALLVAVNEYDDDRLPKLGSPVEDATALSRVLGDESVGGFEVEILADENHWVITERVEQLLAESRRDDVVLLHFGCHGLKDDSGGLYLAARNTRSRRLMATGIDSTMLMRMMRASPASSVVLLLDCCFGGAFARGMVMRAADGLGSGDADRNHDGLVSLNELFDYVRERVRAESPNQTPRKWEFEVSGDLYVARSPRHRVTVGDLPGEVQGLLRSADPNFRTLGVDYLAKLAAAADLPRAAAARRMLVDLADDDSRRVSEAAAQALDRTRLQPAQSKVDLGLARQGSRGEPVVIGLGDVPLAQWSSVRADPGLRAWINDGGGLSIRADPVAPGSIAGAVRLSGPAGDATVDVTGWALPDPRRLLDEAVQPARTIVGAPLSEALALTAAAFTYGELGDSQQASKALAWMPDVLRAITDHSRRAIATAAYAWTLDRLGQADAARRWTDQALASLPPDIGDPPEIDATTAGLIVNLVAVHLGDPAKVAAVLQNAATLVKIYSDEQVPEVAIGLAAVAWVAASAGYDAQATSMLDELEQIKGTADDVVFVRAAAAWVRIRLSDPEQALRLLDSVEDAARAVTHVEDRGLDLAILGWVAGQAGDLARGRAFLSDALLAAAWISHLGGNRPSPPWADVIGLLVPNGPRTDRTTTFLGVWTWLCRQILPRPA
ncbi:caspase family protein [Streptosporangiaceae bacterium NEAU-GS5]|nr:caspase family protein [Streptosporangiaceae bacterium NEAU-GS5]